MQQKKDQLNRLKSVKTEFVFDFTEDKREDKSAVSGEGGATDPKVALINSKQEEEGLTPEYMEKVASYFYLNNPKYLKRRKRRARWMREKNTFFTGRPFILFHLSQHIVFLLVAITFPIVSVINCASGHAWMSHVAMGIYLFLMMIFDFIFMQQYVEKQGH